jgi:hypothetical protein
MPSSHRIERAGGAWLAIAPIPVTLSALPGGAG